MKKSIFSVLGIAGLLIGGIADIINGIAAEQQTKKMVENEVQKALAEKNEEDEDEEIEEDK